MGCAAKRSEGGARTQFCGAAAGILRRSLVVQRTVRPLVVVLLAVTLDEDFRFEQGADELAVKELISQLVVKALDVRRSKLAQ